MEKQEFLNQVLEIGEPTITIETAENEFTIEDGADFVGGKEGTFMSELLGNVYYDSLESISVEMYNYITNELKEEIGFVY